MNPGKELGVSDGIDYWWNHQWEDEVSKRPICDDGHVKVAADIVSYLEAEDLYDSLEKFFSTVRNCFPRQFHEKFMTNEIFLVGMIKLKVWQDKFEEVYYLIATGQFSHPESLISIWDKAHYSEKQKESGITLSPIAKYRIRAKYPPPPNICPDGTRTGYFYPRDVQKLLKTWFEKNSEHPYPSRVELETFADQTKLSLQQIRNWFGNARRRSPAKRKRDDDNRHPASRSEKRNILPKLQTCGNGTLTSSADAEKEKNSSQDAANKTETEIIIVYVPVYHSLDSSKVSTVILPPVTTGQSTTMDGSLNEKLITDIIASAFEINNNSSSSENDEFSSEISSSEMEESVILEQTDTEYPTSTGTQEVSDANETEMKQLAAGVLLTLSRGEC